MGREVVTRLKPLSGWPGRQFCFRSCQAAFLGLIKLLQWVTIHVILWKVYTSYTEARVFHSQCWKKWNNVSYVTSTFLTQVQKLLWCKLAGLHASFLQFVSELLFTITLIFQSIGKPPRQKCELQLCPKPCFSWFFLFATILFKFNLFHCMVLRDTTNSSICTGFTKMKKQEVQKNCSLLLQYFKPYVIIIIA